MIGLRTIRWRDLRLFLINIFLISFLFTITLSIFLGIGRTDPFVSETENTVVLTEPGRDPMFSTVPTYLAEDLLHLEGILAVSPETVDISYQVDQEQPVFVRGVTDEFLKVLDAYRIHSGRWLNFTSGTMECVVGRHYAEELGLHKGKAILIASRRTDLLLSMTIVGIIETDTNADDSILLPLWIGQILSDYATTDVKLMRIRFDPALTSGQAIRETVNTEFQVTVETLRYNSTNFDPNGTIVDVFDRNQAQIESGTYSANEQVISFLLPFGTYSFVANPADLKESRPISVFVDKNGGFQLFVGTPNFTLAVHGSYNEKSVAGATMTIFSLDNIPLDTKIANDEGTASFILPEGLYDLSTDYLGTENRTSISLYEPSTIQISLTAALQVSFLNATTMEPLAGVSLALFAANDTLLASAITDNNGRAFLQGQPGPLILNASWNGFERVEPLTLSGTTELNLTLGYATVIVNVTERNQAPVDNAVVKIKHSEVVVASSNTNASGIAQFELLAGKTYEFQASSAELDEENSAFVRLNQSMTINISLGLQNLIVRVLNTTTHEPIHGAELIIQNVNNTDEQLSVVTNSEGYGEALTRYDAYQIIANYHGVTTIGGVLFSAETAYTVTTLWLGNVSVSYGIFGPNNESLNATVYFYLMPEFLNHTIQQVGLTSTIWTYPGHYEVEAENDSLGYTFTGEFDLFKDSQLSFTLQREPLNLTLVFPTNESTMDPQTPLEFSVSGSNGTLYYRWDAGSNQTTTIHKMWDRQLFFVKTPGPSGNHSLEIDCFGYEGAYLTGNFVFVVNNSLPRITLLNPTNESAVPGGTDVQLKFGGTNTSYLYRWDNDENSSSSIGKSPRVPGTPGTHTLQIWAANYDLIWNRTTYQFITDNPPLTIREVNPDNGSFVPTGGKLAFSIEGYNGTLLYAWNDNGTNSTQKPFTTTIPIPADPGLQRLQVFVVDWNGAWMTAYYEFVGAYFLRLNFRNASTGRTFMSGEVWISNASQTVAVHYLYEYPQEYIPLQPDNYSITLLAGGGLNLTKYVEVIANTSITYSIAALTINPYNMTTKIPIEQGFIFITSETGETQHKPFSNQHAAFLVVPGRYSLRFYDSSWNFTQLTAVRVLEDSKLEWYLGTVEIAVHVRSHNDLDVSDATLTVWTDEILSQSQITTTNISEMLVQVQTNDTGWATLYLPDGTHQIIVTIGTSREEFQVNADTPQQLEVTLQATGTLIIRIDSEKGVPVGNVGVQLKDSTGVIQRAHTNAGGEVIFQGVTWGPIALQITHGDYEKLETFQLVEGIYLKTITIPISNDQLPQQVEAGKWPGRRSYTIEDSRQQLRLYEKFLLSVIATAIVTLAIVTILSLIGVFATVAHPLLDERHSMRVLRTLGATQQQTLGAITAELALPATGVAFIASGVGLIVVSQVPFFQVVSIGGFLILPVTTPILAIIMMLVLGLMIAVSAYLQALKAPEMRFTKIKRREAKVKQ